MAGAAFSPSERAERLTILVQTGAMPGFPCLSACQVFGDSAAPSAAASVLVNVLIVFSG